MNKKIAWLTLICLMVVTLLLASCVPAVPEPEEEKEVMSEEEVAQVISEEEKTEKSEPGQAKERKLMSWNDSSI